MLLDFHTHMDAGKLDDYIQNKVACMVNCMTLEEVKVALAYRAQYSFIKVSIGCHPNTPELLESLLPYYKDGDVIGEIGLDNNWSQADLTLQKEAFIKSLEVATKYKKTVILHTKGMEKEIADIIKDYPLTYIIHWYSGNIETLRLLKTLNTYFTIGPDVMSSQSVQNVVNEIDSSRLLIETDGIEAIRWIGSPLSISDTLDEIISYICQKKEINKENFIKHLNDQFNNLLK
ncbi:MAG: TatD family hydrolase [Clostridia bacterium]|nr:TatD family hydrolase [Clostridia bacterium]